MKFITEVANIKVRAELCNKICFIQENSGTGKTYFFKILAGYCIEHGIPCRYINYNMADSTLSALLGFIDNSEIVILDNADLYYKTGIIDALSKLDFIKHILIACHTALPVYPPLADYYSIKYARDTLTCSKSEEL